MGRKTSVWLPDDLAERVRASGVPMAELIRRGLDAGAPVPLEEMVRGALRAELALSAARGDIPAESSREEAAGQHGILVRGAVAGRGRTPRTPPPPAPGRDAGDASPQDARSPGRSRCPHPGTRTAGGFCRKCDSRVEPGGWLPDGWGSRHDR